MLKQKSILQAGSQESVFYKLIDGLESALKASVSGFIKFLRIRTRGRIKANKTRHYLLVLSRRFWAKFHSRIKLSS